MDDLKQTFNDTVTELENALREGGITRFWQVFEEKQNEWKNETVNIAITGRSGSGKSSFINALMKKWTGKPGLAAIGVPKATTEYVGYAHPCNPNIILWDLPGVGTEASPQEEDYLTEVNAELYDVFIIMTSTRFTELDDWLGEQLQERNIPVIFVRTKTGIDVHNFKHDHIEMDDTTVLREALVAVKKDMVDRSVKILKNLGAFLIDSHHFDMYDFSDLDKYITERLPAYGGKALVHSIRHMFRNVLKLKVAELKKQIVSVTLAAAAFGTIPLMSTVTDEIIVRMHASFYMKQLGLDQSGNDIDESRYLCRNAESLGEKSINPDKLSNLRSKVDKVMADIPKIVKMKGIDTWHGSVIHVLGDVLVRTVPLVNTCMSAFTVASSLKDILGRFEAIMQEAIDSFSE